MKTVIVLLLISITLLGGCIFFFAQRSQFAAAALDLELERESAQREMNREIDQDGQASESTRWRWLELGNDWQ